MHAEPSCVAQTEMFQSLQHILDAARLWASRRWSSRLEPQRAFSTYRRSRRAFALGAPSRRPFNCGSTGGC